jgi:hypothetical protein
MSSTCHTPCVLLAGTYSAAVVELYSDQAHSQTSAGGRWRRALLGSPDPAPAAHGKLHRIKRTLSVAGSYAGSPMRLFRTPRPMHTAAAPRAVLTWRVPWAPGQECSRLSWIVDDNDIMMQGPKPKDWAELSSPGQDVQMPLPARQKAGVAQDRMGGLWARDSRQLAPFGNKSQHPGGHI